MSVYRDWVARYQCTVTGWPGISVPRLGGRVYRDWVAGYQCTVTGWPGVSVP